MDSTISVVHSPLRFGAARYRLAMSVAFASYQLSEIGNSHSEDAFGEWYFKPGRCIGIRFELHDTANSKH